MRTYKGLIVAGVFASGVVAMAYDDGDWQFWGKFEAGGKIEGGLEPKIEQEARYGDSMSEFYYTETYLSLGYKVTDWFKPAIGFAQIYERENKPIYSKTGDTYSEKSDHSWKQEQDTRVDLNFSTKAMDWGLEDRVRMEYRDKDGAHSYMRYRNRIRVKSPWEVTPIKINPYAAWETNYEDDSEKNSEDRWNRHRIYAGVGAKFGKQLKGGLYYMNEQNKKAGEWTDVNVIGLEVGASF
jgi:hypothetical protein